MQGTFGGATTLILVDGHRLVGMGNGSTEPDPDVLPPGIIDRVEIVPDGGSAQYGSDAVAGVINFITLRRFNGVRADASYGFADHFWRYDANLTVGRDWGSGSIYASYNYARNSDLLGRDRDYIRQFPDAITGRTSLTCSPGNITALAGVFSPAGTVVGVPRGGAVTAPNQCDSSDDQSLNPASRRHSAFAGLTQDLAPGLTFELRGFYTNRRTSISGGAATYSELLAPGGLVPGFTTSPYATVGFIFLPVPPFAAPYPNSANTIDLVEQVDGRIPGHELHSTVELDTFSINPSITADLGHTFRLRVQTGYGESTARFIGDAVNEPALQAAIVSGAFNPFAQTTTSSAVTDAVTNFESFNRTRQRQFDVKTTIDGDLFRLPAGAVKIAVGGEYLDERLIADNGQVIPGYEYGGFAGSALIPPQAGVRHFDLGRHVASAFGEIVAPIFGSGNGPSLTVSAAGRYDHYNDVGDTFNPRFGATFKPISWVSIRGAYGKSFNAPSLADQPQASLTTGYVLTGGTAAFFAPPASLTGAGQPYPAYNGGTIVAIRGNAPGIQPQKATTWNVGFDIQPPFVPGLSLGATYYNIRYNNLIGVAPFQTPAVLYRDFRSLVTINPSQAFLDAQLATVNQYGIGSPPVVASQVYAFLDARKRNLGEFQLDGIDMRLSYQSRTGFGSLFANVNGTYELNRKQNAQAGAAFQDLLAANNSRFRIRTSAGIEVGPVSGQVTWNHLAGYRLDPTVGYVPQSHIGAFDTFDLYFRVAVPALSVTHDTALTVNIDNVLNQDPPEYRGGNPIGGQQGILNGATIGRFVRFGLTTRF